MKNIFLISIYFILLHISPLYGQTDFTNVQGIVSPSPEAASLGKYGAIPLNQYTGQTGINLPIYSVNADGMNLPISLSYQGDAIRVRDRASRVGLGWSLNAGGVVTRVMRGGMPDDIIDWIEYDGAPACIRGKLHGGDAELPEPDFVDTEHDMFYFNFLGYSGKFIFKNQNEVLFFPHTNLKVEVDWEYVNEPGNCSYDKIQNIYITTPDGIKYSFTEREGTIYHTPFSRSYYYNSAWYLTQITHPNNQTIDLTYQYLGLYGNGFDYSKEEIVGSNTANCNCRADGVAASSQTFHDIKKLDRITFTNGEIVFDGDPRNDLIPDESINNIKVYNEGILVKEFQLNQSYFISPGGNSANYKRLRLDNVVEIGGVESITLYDFTYNMSVALPHRLSNEIDVWGYYNANGASGDYTQNNYDDLFPTIYFYPDDPAGDRFSVYPRDNYFGAELIYEGSDRRSDPTAIQAGMLKKITYPTGGSTEFEYELHEFEYKGNKISGGGLRLKSLTNDAINGPGLSKAFNYSKENGSTSGAVTGIPQYAYMCTNPDDDEIDNCIDVDFSYELIIQEYPYPEPPEYQTLLTYSIQGFEDADIDYIDLNGIIFNEAEGTIILDGGDYPPSPPVPPTQAANFTAYFNSGCYVTTSITLQLDQPQIETLCNRDDGACPSSGAFNFVKLINDQNKFGSHSGSFIGYSRVEEVIGGFGKVVYEYTNPETNPDLAPVYEWDGGNESQACIDEYQLFYNEYDVYPFPKGTSKDFERGLLQKKLVYSEDDLQTPVQTEDFFYEFHSVGTVNESYMVKFGDEPQAIPYAKGGSWDLESKIVLSDYMESTLDNITTTTDFTYTLFTYADGVTKFNKSSESVTNTGGEIFTTSYSYANDLNDVLTYNNYMIGIPLETHAPGGNGQKMEFTQSGNRILPYKYYTKGFQPNICAAAKNGIWKLAGTVTQYDGIYPQNISAPCEANDNVLTWANDRLDKQEFIDQQTTFSYNAKGLLESITDPNDLVSSFKYDDFERLEELQSRNGAIVDAFTYNLGLASGGENYVEKETTMDVNVPTSKSYVDGLGRGYKSVLEEYTYGQNDLSLYTTYDALGRITLQDDPRKGAAWVSELEKSVIGRKEKEYAAGWPRSISYTYLSETFSGGDYFKTLVTDENENDTELLIDKVGRTRVERKFLDGSPVETVYEYNQRGDVTSITQPDGALFSYTYYPDGKLESETIPGKGTINYEYNDRDLLWKVSDNGTIENLYDAYGRVVQIKLNGKVISDLNYYAYTAGPGSRGQLSQRVDDVLGTTETVTRSFTYDAYGRAATTTYIHLLGTDVFNYTYNDRDQVEFSTRTTHEGKVVTYDYIYDHGGRMTEILMTLDGVSETISIMEYNERDWVVNDRLGVDPVSNLALTEIGYGYNSRGWLKKINDIGDCILPSPAPLPGNEHELTHDEGSIEVYYDANALATGAPSTISIVSEMEMYEGDSLIYIVEDTIIIPKGSYGFEAPYANSQNYQLLGAFDLSATGDLIATNIINAVSAINPDLSSTSLLRDDYFREEIDDRMNEIPRHTTCQGDALFAEEIYYLKTNDALNALSQYNGNISYLRWRALNRSYSPAYGFEYDDLYRMEKANYGEKNLTGTGNWQNFDRYSATYSYDITGNLSTLTRNGLIDIPGNITYDVIDDLTYIYTGGRLDQVTDNADQNRGFKSSGGSYTYDGRGNVTSAPNVSSIGYNHLNLPESLSLANGGTLTNFYDATGVKVKKVVTPPSPNPNNETGYTRHYVDGIEYKDQAIESIHHEKGRILYENGSAFHEYVIRDHAGSGRVWFSDKNDNGKISTKPVDGEVTQEQHYYPFGMSMDGVDFITPVIPISDKWYTGMEYQKDGDFGWYDYGARFYDPAVGRFMQVDPMATATPSNDVYVYALNNPVRFVDPTGMLASEIIDLGGGKCSDCFDSVTISGMKGLGANSFSYSRGKRSDDEDSNSSDPDPDPDPKPKKKGLAKLLSNLGNWWGSLFSQDIDDTETAILQSKLADENRKKLLEDIETIDDVLSIFPWHSLSKALADIERGEYGAALAASPFIIVDLGGGSFVQVAKSLKGGFKLVGTVGRFVKYEKVVPAKIGGQSRAVYVKIKDLNGKTIKMYKDTYGKNGEFIHRKHKYPFNNTSH